MSIPFLKKTIALLLICFTCLYSFGQEYILKEDFNDNNNEWPFILKNNTYEATISEGSMLWHNKSDGDQGTYMFSNEDWDKNFEIETKLKFIEGKKNKFLGFYFSTDDKRSSGYMFGIAINGHFIVENFGNGTTEIKPSWIKTDLIKENDYNILKLRKVADHFFFFLNDSIVYYAKSLQKNDGYIALLVSEGTSVMFDNVYVKEYNESASETSELIDKFSAEIGKEKVLLNEEFSTNKENWKIGDAETNNTKIESGSFYCENKGDTYLQKTIKNPINWSLDFQIQAKIKRVSGTTDNLYGITYDFDSWKRYSYFGFAPSGHWIVREEVNDKEAYTSGWQKKDGLIKEASYNLLTIEKVGNQLLFFINNEWVHAKKDVQKTGDYIGYIFCEKSKSEVDYLKIKQYFRTEKEQEVVLKKLLPKSVRKGTSKTKKVERLSDKKHKRHRNKIINSWRGRPITALKKSWGTPVYQSSGSSGRCFYKYKIINGKQSYYQVNFFGNGGKYGPVVGDIYFTNGPFF